MRPKFLVDYLTAFVGWMAVTPRYRAGHEVPGAEWFWWGLLLVASIAIIVMLIRERLTHE